VKVTPLGKVASNSGTQSSTDNTVTLAEGQMVVITSVIPSAGFQATSTPPAEAQNLQLATDVPDGNLPPPGDTRYATPTHAARTLLVGGAISVGLALGLGLGTRGGHTVETGTQGCKPSPAVVCPGP
jgi:hypothetical protein